MVHRWQEMSRTHYAEKESCAKMIFKAWLSLDDTFKFLWLRDPACCRMPLKTTNERFYSSYLAFGISFLLQRIISHLVLSCVIIFLYLKREREPLFAKTYGATTLGIDGRMIDVEADVSPGLLGLEFVGDSTLGETVMSLTFHIL